LLDSLLEITLLFVKGTLKYKPELHAELRPYHVGEIIAGA
jgi:hypothetical protein